MFTYTKPKLNKLNISLKFFEKLIQLTPSQVNCLKDYSQRIKTGKGNPALLERIGAILRKPHIQDPIIDFKFPDNWDKLYPPKKKLTS
jgi:hypothetical protein